MPRETSAPEIGALSAKLKAVADPARLRIIGIMSARDGAACECELAGPMQLSQPTLSHHLSVLRRAGLVEPDPARPPGQCCVYYRLRPDAISGLARELGACIARPGPDPPRSSGRSMAPNGTPGPGGRGGAALWRC